MPKKKALKVQFCADGTHSVDEIDDYTKTADRIDKRPEDPKPGSSLSGVTECQPLTTEFYARCPATHESTDVDERRREPLLVRPPYYDVRAAAGDGHAQAEACGGSSMRETGEIASGRPAGDVAQETSATREVRDRKRKRHRGTRIHKKK